MDVIFEIYKKNRCRFVCFNLIYEQFFGIFIDLDNCLGQPRPTITNKARGRYSQKIFGTCKEIKDV